MIKAQDPAPVVQFSQVVKTYSGNRVVDELSFSVPRGTTFGLLGPNGAGKSTSLKALMGLLKIDSGRIDLFGEDISKIRQTSGFVPLRQRVGYVSEEHNIYRWMKVWQAIKFVKSFYTTWNEPLVDELLGAFELDSNRKVSQLSKGMLAKLSLLLAVGHEPELLILNEPTSGLDAMIREEFLYGILKSIADTDRTVIFSSHSIDDVQRIADRVALVRGGKLVVDRTVDEILASTKRLRAALKDNTKPAWVPESTIWQEVERREWQLTVGDYSPEMLHQFESRNEVESLEVRDLSLEDIFKDYVRGGRKQSTKKNWNSKETSCLAN